MRTVVLVLGAVTVAACNFDPPALEGAGAGGGVDAAAPGTSADGGDADGAPVTAVDAAPPSPPDAMPPPPDGPPDATCPDGWVENGASCYQFVNGFTADYFSADGLCQLSGARLVTIDDSAENVFVGGSMGGSGGDRFWIGLDDVGSDGEYGWTSGAPVVFESWGSGEPDESGSCVASSNTGIWEDRSCFDSRTWVCEKPL